jgi:hypothetical protein
MCEALSSNPSPTKKKKKPITKIGLVEWQAKALSLNPSTARKKKC